MKHLLVILTLTTAQAKANLVQAQRNYDRSMEIKKVNAQLMSDEQLEQLNGFAALLNSSLDAASVREKALEATCRLLGCETASIPYLVDREHLVQIGGTAGGKPERPSFTSRPCPGPTSGNRVVHCANARPRPD